MDYLKCPFLLPYIIKMKNYDFMCSLIDYNYKKGNSFCFHNIKTDDNYSFVSFDFCDISFVKKDNIVAKLNNKRWYYNKTQTDRTTTISVSDEDFINYITSKEIKNIMFKLALNR